MLNVLAQVPLRLIRVYLPNTSIDEADANLTMDITNATLSMDKAMANLSRVQIKKGDTFVNVKNQPSHFLSRA